MKIEVHSYEKTISCDHNQNYNFVLSEIHKDCKSGVDKKRQSQ